MGVHKIKRTGRWVAQRWDPIAGKNVQVGTRATRKEALELLRKAEAERPHSAMTVQQWWDLWLRTETWRGSTRRHHRERTARFVAEHGVKRLAAIDRGIARVWVKQRPGDHASLSAMFGAATYEDDEHGRRLLSDNPFAKLVRKKVARRDIQADWLTDEEVAELERHARKTHGEVVGETVAAMIRFAAETGVRPGELFVLEEADLDVANGKLHVRRAVDSLRVLGPPKNGEQRVVVLSERAAQAAMRAARYEGAVTPMPVLDHRDQPIKGDEFWLPKGTPRLFSTVTGKQWQQPTLSTHWGPVRRAAGREGMDFYELRHFCATRLLDLGLRDDEVAVQLGHTDGGELVRKTYGHPNNRRALDRVRDALDGREAA